MMLGDLLARITDDATAAKIILDVGDLPMLNAMRECAGAEGLDLAAYSRGVVRRYALEASDEEWSTMIGLISRSDDPGTACLKRAFSKALST